MKVVIAAFLIEVRSIKIITGQINFVAANNLNLILDLFCVTLDLYETTNSFMVGDSHTSMTKFNCFVD